MDIGYTQQYRLNRTSNVFSYVYKHCSISCNLSDVWMNIIPNSDKMIEIKYIYKINIFGIINFSKIN